jgi:hypothetical protein
MEASMTDDRHNRIRVRAHAIWETQGRPHGADRQHWDQATREIDAEDAAAGSKRPRAPKTTAPKAAPASKASRPAARKPAAKPKPAE